MGSLSCFTCGTLLSSLSVYHIHNINVHSLEELSSTILKILFTEEEKVAHKKNTESHQANNSSSHGYVQECMDEIIELGTMEGEDNLTVQSLLLKSNFAPNSRHIIEVQEKKQPKDVMKVLSQELNAAVINFQNNFLTAGITVCLNKQFEKTQMNSPQLLPNETLKTRKKSKRRGKTKHSKFKHFLNGKSPEYSPCKLKSLEDVKSNVKIVLRSGRTIKATPKYKDFIYYDNYKENLLSSNGLFPNQLRENVDEAASTRMPISEIYEKESSVHDGQSTKLLDLLPDEFNLDDLNISSELDIKIEDLDLSGLDDLDGTLPENQILTIENLLQELEGGGSIEISNIIKENNVDSDTVVLDALSHPSGNYGDINLGNGVLPEKIRSTDKSISKRLKSRTLEITKSFCNICNKRYASKINYENHMKTFHINTIKNIYKCSICNQIFPFLATLQRHYKELHPNQTFLCEKCGRNFRTLINLKIHSELHNESITYHCQFCPNKYFGKYSYLRHVKSHNSSNKFYCEKCDRYFSQKHHYNKHLSNHKKGKYLGISKDLKCNFCNDICNLNSKSISDMNFENCLKCKKGIYKKYLLINKEYQACTSQQESSQPTEECKLCGKRVKQLQKHIRKTHLSNPTVECDVCGKTFKKASLSSHKLRRHKAIEAKCDHCNKTFKNALALREHLNKIKKSQTT